MQPIGTPPFILLASASPRRHEILTQLGIAHGILRVPAPEGEDEPRLPDEDANAYVSRTAHDKARHARAWLQAGGRALLQVPDEWPRDWPHRPLLTADTTVALDDQVLGKPGNADEARTMLRMLSGRTHQVYTAVVLSTGTAFHQALSVSTVEFQVLNEGEIDWYIASREPYGKAGSYAIQGLGGAFVRYLSGSYTGVMGLPAHETTHLLRIHATSA